MYQPEGLGCFLCGCLISDPSGLCQFDADALDLLEQSPWWNSLCWRHGDGQMLLKRGGPWFVMPIFDKVWILAGSWVLICWKWHQNDKESYSVHKEIHWNMQLSMLLLFTPRTSLADLLFFARWPQVSKLGEVSQKTQLGGDFSVCWMAGLNNVVVARERVDIYDSVRLYVHHNRTNPPIIYKAVTK